jgi:hypothetical protein
MQENRGIAYKEKEEEEEEEEFDIRKQWSDKIN